MKVELNKKNIIIKIPVKKLRELFGDCTNSVIPVVTDTGEIKMEETNTPEVPVEEPKQDANIQPETPATDTVVPPQGTEPSAPVQQ